MSKELSAKLSVLVEDKRFKKGIVIVGVILAIGSIFISIKPEAFLKTGYPGVFIYGILGPVTLIIPALSQHLNLVLLSLVASAGIVINDTLAYIVGRNADAFIPKNKGAKAMSSWVEQYGFWALLVISILPIPYDFIGLLVGYLDLSFGKYILPLFIGKFIRAMLIGLGTQFFLNLFGVAF